MKIELKDTFITDNSTQCEKGCYFVKTRSNAQFEEHAKQAGAIIITPQKAYELAKIPADFKIIGITGTNGKTTTATLLAHILNALGLKCANCGTRGAFIGSLQIAPKALTTNQFLTTLALIKTSLEHGCSHFVMEVSSHAIAQNRIEALPFALKIFTNLSQDHLDYHKSFEEYAAAKSSFFEGEGKKLINKDDPHIRYNKANAHFYALKGSGAEYEIDEQNISVGSQNLEFSSHLYGRFNLYNILCAFSAADLLVPNKKNEIIAAIADFAGVPGRTELISKDPTVIVDFAHTPDGIEKVLSSLATRPLIVVMGAGGDRDASKRPIMGQIAASFAKTLIITSDNPRSEEPQKIIEQIKTGANKATKGAKIITESNRKKAIALALSLVKKDEIIAILGKGDEDYQEINGVKHPFSDAAVVRELLKTKPC